MSDIAQVHVSPLGSCEETGMKLPEPYLDIHARSIYKGLDLQDFMKTIEAGIQILNNWANSSFWSWSTGSTLVFWRCEDLWLYARDGFPHFLMGPHPKNKKSARKVPSEIKALYVKKLKNY